MSIINRIVGYFLTIVCVLIFSTITVFCIEENIDNADLILKSNEKFNQNLIVRKVISNRYKVNTLEQGTNFSFKVYPNPTCSDKMKISFKGKNSMISEIKLINLNLFYFLKSDSFIFNNETLQFCKMEKGNYLLTIILENGNCYSQKIEIE